MTAALLLASLVGVSMKARAAPSSSRSRTPPTSPSSPTWPASSPSSAAKMAGPAASEPEAGGTHTRLLTNHGPVHLFRPPGFDRRTAGVVVYVHGYYTHIDEAWQEHKLAEQFSASRRNALFIAPEAPGAPEEEQSWSSLRRLLTIALRAAKVGTPPGPLVVVGHSGAYRTLVQWLNEPTLHHLILVDALYGNEPDFLDWLAHDRANRMTLVVKGTARWADPFVKKLPYAITLPQIPTSIYQLSREQRTAKLLYLRSQYGHFELITEGRTLPVLLGRGGLRLIPRGHPRKS